MLEKTAAEVNKIKQKIKTEANNLGFSHIGFTTPENPAHYDVFSNWLLKGFAADMDYLKRDDTLLKRADPKLILPECKSIIVFGLPYSPANLLEERFPKIASYALGEDYHHIIPKLLEKIVSVIKDHLPNQGIVYKIYTDTGPILEKELAAKAGLGWIGKNSCLISPDIGSYIFLSEILINIEFEPDPPFLTDHCGSCTRCMDACPTRCILPNRTIDARNCISYLTIENRKSIKEEYREKINDWIFGCDICQMVCPWNIRFAKIPHPNYFEYLEIIIEMDVVEELWLENKDFKAKYQNSPILRTKHEGHLRNILIAMSNHFRNEYEEPLQDFIKQSPNEDLKKLANWVLEKK